MKPNQLHIAVLAILSLFLSSCFSGNKIVKVVCSENDGQIFQDGKLAGIGTAAVKIPKNSYSTVMAKKTGFFNSETLELYNDKNHPKPSQTIPLVLMKDDGFEASVFSDIANKDVQLVSGKAEDDCWKIVSQAITSQFENLELIDKSSGYIKTHWVFNSFKTYTIRSRVILRICSSGSQSCYIVKIFSEKVNRSGATAKDDEDFRPWDRVMKKYNEILPEIQARLK